VSKVSKFSEQGAGSMTNNGKWIYNPVRVTLALPHDVDLNEIDWSDVRAAAEPTNTEEQPVRARIMECVTSG
jgi:hypothetical protein